MTNTPLARNAAKIRRAVSVTDSVVSHWNRAFERLQLMWINGAGVISDPSSVLADAKAARDSLDKVIAELDAFRDWPIAQDYGEE